MSSENISFNLPMIMGVISGDKVVISVIWYGCGYGRMQQVKVEVVVHHLVVQWNREDLGMNYSLDSEFWDYLRVGLLYQLQGYWDSYWKWSWPRHGQVDLVVVKAHGIGKPLCRFEQAFGTKYDLVQWSYWLHPQIMPGHVPVCIERDESNNWSKPDWEVQALTLWPAHTRNLIQCLYLISSTPRSLQLKKFILSGLDLACKSRLKVAQWSARMKANRAASRRAICSWNLLPSVDSLSRPRKLAPSRYWFVLLPGISFILPTARSSGVYPACLDIAFLARQSWSKHWLKSSWFRMGFSSWNLSIILMSVAPCRLARPICQWASVGIT